MNSDNNLDLYTFTNFTELNECEINLVHKERNNLDVRGKMFDDKIIPMQEHLKFLENLKKDNTKIFILVKLGQSVTTHCLGGVLIASCNLFNPNCAVSGVI